MSIGFWSHEDARTLSERDVLRCYDAYVWGLTPLEVQRELGLAVSASTVWDAIHGQRRFGEILRRHGRTPETCPPSI